MLDTMTSVSADNFDGLISGHEYKQHPILQDSRICTHWAEAGEAVTFMCSWSKHDHASELSESEREQVWPHAELVHAQHYRDDD